MNRLLFRWRHWLLLAVCLGSLGVYLASLNQRNHNRLETRELERLTLQSKVMENHLTGLLTVINRSIQSIIDEQPNWNRSATNRMDGIRHLKALEVAIPSVRTFLVLDAKGEVTTSNREELIGRNFYQREYFQAPLRSSNSTTLHISPPFKSLRNVYVINLSRAVLDGSGKFSGVVTATVEPADLQIFLSTMLYTGDMQSSLLHGNGTVFVFEPPTPGVVGKNLSDPASFFGQHRSSGRAVNHFIGTSSATGDPRLVVLRTLQPPELSMDQPLIIAISRKFDSLFVEWRNDVQNQFLAYLLLVLLGAAGVVLYQRQLAQRRISNQRLKLASQASRVGIWEYDLSTRRYHWDAAMFQLFGLTPQSVNERNDDWRELLLPGELERMKDATRATIAHDQPFDLIFQIRRKDGQLRYLRNRAALYCDDRELPNRLIGTTDDITVRKLQEADLRIAATAFESHESMLVTDARAVILRVNHAFTELFGYTAEEVLGQTLRILHSGRQDQTFYETLWESLRRDGAWQGEIWNRRKNGDIFPQWLTITAVRSDEGLVTHYVATHVDITLRKAAEEEIRSLAFFDPLTGLPNRRLLQDRLHQAIVKAKREQQHLALLFIDLDKFKPVNDDYGHQVGDELLLAVARRLQACVRESDTVARVGGDEFVVLLPGIERAQDAGAVARKIHDALIEPFPMSGGQSVNISSSTGVATYPEHGSDETQLMQHADAAMYQAKAAGRDRFVVFEASL